MSKEIEKGRKCEERPGNSRLGNQVEDSVSPYAEERAEIQRGMPPVKKPEQYSLGGPIRRLGEDKCDLSKENDSHNLEREKEMRQRCENQA